MFTKDANGNDTWHKIEESAKVYLLADDDGWSVDPLTFDGYPLDGYERGATNEACECEGDEADCNAARAKADRFYLPTGDELAVMLILAALDHSGIDAEEFLARVYAAVGCVHQRKTGTQDAVN